MKDRKKKTKTLRSLPTVSLKRYAYIDALRGIAILGVILAHISLYSNVLFPIWLTNLTDLDLGPRGVQLFYVVSAFTLCVSFHARKTGEKHPIRNFYIRRFFRIAPLYYLFVFYFIWQLNYWKDIPHTVLFFNVLSTLTFTNGLSPFWINNTVHGGWSIAVESTFYLLFPLLYSKLRTIRFAIVITIIIAISMQLLRLFLLTLPFVKQNPDLQTYTFQFFPSQLPVFLVGMTIFLLYTKMNQHDKRFLQHVLIGIGVVLLIQQFLPLKLLPGHYVFALVFAILLLVLSKYPISLLVNRVTIFLGKISFSLYLCHVPCYYWLYHLGLNHILPSNPLLNFTLRFIIVLSLSSVIATILFSTIEKGGIILGKKIIGRYEKITASYQTTATRTW